MSWLDKLQNVEFEIKTGDGRTYKPLLMEMEKTKEYNTSLFDFIDVPGTLVERKNPKGGKYPLTFFFQGTDCFTLADEFEASADDRRYWVVTHPVYGQIKGQPISLSRNDRSYNVVEFKIDFYQTIVFDFPYTKINVRDNVLVKQNEFLFSSANAFAAKQSSFNAEDINKLKQANEVTAANMQPLQTNETYAEYLNALSEGQKAADKLRVDAHNAILTTQKLINGPSTYDTHVLPRVNSFKSLFKSFDTLLKSVFDKSNYEAQAGTTIASLCNAAVNYDTDSDYQVTTEVDIVVQTIIDMYNQYNEVLDSATTSGDSFNNNSWQPSADAQTFLNQLVLYTISELYNLAFDAMQLREVFLTKDSNIILLTHKYYGLANDSNIESFCKINNITLNERFKLKKGRSIKFYR